MGLRSSKVTSEPEYFGSIQNNVGEPSICRICLENEGTMIKPCVCSGSIEAVHERCMASWIKSKLCINEEINIKCEICKQEIMYQLSWRFICQPSKCFKRVDKINPCVIAAILVFFIAIIVLSVIIAYSGEQILISFTKTILIIVLSVSCIGIFSMSAILLVSMMTKKLPLVKKVYNRSQKKQNIEQHRQTSSFTSIMSSQQSSNQPGVALEQMAH